MGESEGESIAGDDPAWLRPVMIAFACVGAVVLVVLIVISTSGDDEGSDAERAVREQRDRVAEDVRRTREQNVLIVCGLSEDDGILREAGYRGYSGPEGDFPNATNFDFDPYDPSDPVRHIAVTFDVELVAFSSCG